jgi:hypothetical protein
MARINEKLRAKPVKQAKSIITSDLRNDSQHLTNHAVITQIFRLASTVRPVPMARDAYP